MTILPIYIFSGSNPCPEGEIPYKRQVCNDVENGLLDSEKYMGNEDAWYGASTPEQYLWLTLPETDKFAKDNQLSSGNLYFLDTDNLKMLFKLPRLLITRSRVREAMKLIWRFKYEEQGGNPGYIVQDPDSASGTTWYPLTALADGKVRSDYGNPVVSLLDMVSNLLDATFDALLPGLANLIPWWAYLAAAGYTGIKAKQSFPKKFDLQKVDIKTYGFGLATVFLAYRAYRSWDAKAERNDQVAGRRKPRVARKTIVYPKQSLN